MMASLQPDAAPSSAGVRLPPPPAFTAAKIVGGDGTDTASCSSDDHGDAHTVKMARRSPSSVPSTPSGGGDVPLLLKRPTIGRRITAPCLGQTTELRYQGDQGLTDFDVKELRWVSRLGGAATGAFEMADNNGAKVGVCGL